METIREARVIDNNDPNKKGKVKIRILPEMLSFKDSELPWMSTYQQGEGISADVGTHGVPEKDTFIRVLIEDYPIMKRIRYISDDYVEGMYIYSKASGLSAIAELSSQAYPQPLFHIFKDGTITFHNSSTGEHGTLYKNGQYELFDKDGNWFVYIKNKQTKIYNDSGSFILKTDGVHELSGNTKSLTTHAELNTSLQSELTALNGEYTKIATSITSLVAAVTALGQSGTPYVPVPVTLDISSSESAKIKTS